MASAAGGGAAGEGEWLKVSQLRPMVEAQDPNAKVSCSSIHPHPPSTSITRSPVAVSLTQSLTQPRRNYHHGVERFESYITWLFLREN